MPVIKEDQVLKDSKEKQAWKETPDQLELGVVQDQGYDMIIKFSQSDCAIYRVLLDQLVTQVLMVRRDQLVNLDHLYVHHVVIATNGYYGY